MFDHCLYFNATALARRLGKEWAIGFKRFSDTPPQCFMARLILKNPGLLQHELTTQLTTSRPTATRLLEGLQTLGLVERRGTGLDGRHLAMSPTEKAKAIHAGINRASGEVTLRIKQRSGRETCDGTISRIRTLFSALT